MRKIDEALRLQPRSLSRREISQSIGVSKTTVGESLAHAQAAGIGWPLPKGMDESALEVKLFLRPNSPLR